MKKKLRVIQINGFRGLCFALAVLTCLIAGFVVFPGVVAMAIWNIVATKTMLFPTLGIPQGVLLWGIMVVSYMIIKKRHFAVSFKTPTELSDEELDAVVQRIKSETAKSMMTDVIAKSRMSNKPVILDSDDIIAAEENKELETTNKNIDN